jgi:hypothetical protein
MPWSSQLMLILLASTSVLCDECVTYDFEQDFDDLFTFDNGVCNGMAPWKIQQYEGVSNPYNMSSQFMSPTEGEMFSCVSSFAFPVHRNGLFEINVYMEPGSNLSQLSIIVQSTKGGTINNLVHTPMSPDFVPGWTALQLKVPGDFNAYVSLH